MAPKTPEKSVAFKDLDQDGQTERLHLRARQLQLAKHRMLIGVAVKQRDDICADVWKYIQTLGVSEASLSLKKKLPRASSAEDLETNPGDTQAMEFVGIDGI